MKFINSLNLLKRIQKHKNRWKDCQLCPLSEKRYKVVLYRGNIPSDVLLISEAPGQSEDVIGKPFVGPAGSVLDNIMLSARAMPGTPHFTFSVTSIVSCIPLDVEGTIRQPHKLEVIACQDRLIEYIDIANPSLIVTLGKVSKNKFPPQLDTPIKSLIHPAAILRLNQVRADIETARCISYLARWIGRYCGETKSGSNSTKT